MSQSPTEKDTASPHNASSSEEQQPDSSSDPPHDSNNENSNDNPPADANNDTNGNKRPRDEEASKIYDDQEPPMKRPRTSSDSRSDSADDTNDRKVMVKNLAFSATEDEVREYFSQYGEVESVYLPVFRDSQRSKGYGFVVFSSPEASKQALEASGQEFLGRTIHVQTPRDKNSFSGKTNEIYVGNLPFEATEDDVGRYLEDCGRIIDVRMPGRRKGFAFVEFDSVDAVREALRRNREEFMGRRLKINEELKRNKRYGPGHRYARGPPPRRGPPGGPRFSPPPRYRDYPPYDYDYPPSPRGGRPYRDEYYRSPSPYHYNYGGPPPPRYSEPAPYDDYGGPPPQRGYDYPPGRDRRDDFPRDRPERYSSPPPYRR